MGVTADGAEEAPDQEKGQRADVDSEMRRLVELVGGADNVSSVSHCLTRLRFVLADPAKADTQGIDKLPSVKGSFVNAGQFQVVIGNEVEDYHKALLGLLGEGAAASKEETKKAARKNMKWYERAIAHLAEIFVPLLPALITGGLILGFRNVITDIKMVDGKPLTEVGAGWSTTADFLWLIGEAIFHFLPVGVCWSTVKKMGGTEILGIMLGITLVSPQLMNAYLIDQQQPGQWDFGWFHIAKVGYQAQVIPAVLAGLALSVIELRLKKIVPHYLHQVIVPFVSLVVTVFLAHALLGPIGRQIGEGIGWLAKSAMTGAAAPVGGLVFGFLYAPLVVTGVHHATNAVDLQLIQQLGGTPIWPLIALSNMAQASAVLAVFIAYRKNQKIADIALPSTVSAYLGVTEPALYGVNLRLRYPLIAGMTGSGLAGMICGIAGVRANGIGVGGLPGILSVQHRYWGTYAIAMAVAIGVPILITLYMVRRSGAIDPLAEGAP